MESIHEKIKRIRVEKRINQIELANSIGVSRSAYILIENGSTKSISIELGKRIAKALEASFNELFDIENPDLEKAIEANDKLNKELEFYQRLDSLDSENTKQLEVKSKYMDRLSNFVKLLYYFNLVDRKKIMADYKDQFNEGNLVETFSFESVLRFFVKNGDDSSIDIILKYIDAEKLKNASDYVFDKSFWHGMAQWDKAFIEARIKELNQRPV